MLILVFSVTLRWFPSSGISTYGRESDVLSRLSHLVLPAVTLATLQLAIYMRFTRSGMLEVLGQDYVRTARAKGLGNWSILIRHALRNALFPLITVLGFSLKSLFSGAVLVETVFAWPGLGRLTVDAVFARDYPLIMGVTILIAVVTVFSNLMIDILYAVADPRIRYQ
jgi:peptide/nickel transport system permease protein